MEGQRVAKSGGGRKKLPWIIAGTAAAVLAAGYLGLCAWAAQRETILPNVSVAGIDVSNMQVEQARKSVETALAERSGNISFTLSYEELSETISGKDVKPDAAQSAQNAGEIGRENFLTGGFQFLSHTLGASSQVPLAIPEDDPAG